MRNTPIAFIPARGGSKGIKDKNLQNVGGVPLIMRTIQTAQKAEIESIYVSTDSEKISRVAKDCGAIVIDRPSDLSSDTTETSLVLEHSYSYLKLRGHNDFSPFFLLQCTSPFLNPKTLIDMNEGIDYSEPFLKMTTYGWHGVLWDHVAGELQPYGHSAERRIRRQDASPLFLETGAAYLTRLVDISTPQIRASRKIYSHNTSLIESFQIDTPEELEFCNFISGLMP